MSNQPIGNNRLNLSSDLTLGPYLRSNRAGKMVAWELGKVFSIGSVMCLIYFKLGFQNYFSVFLI